MPSDETGAIPTALAQRLDALDQRLAALAEQHQHVTNQVNVIRQLSGQFGVPMGGNRILVQTVHSLQYMVDANDLIITPQMILYRQWEAEITRLFLQLLGPGKVFVDVGANFGYFTCLAGVAMRPTPGSKIIAVEPHPFMLELLRANVQINWSMAPISIVPKAIAGAPGWVDLLIPADRAANASMAPPGAASGALPPGTRAHAVEAMTLDALLADEPQVDLIKVDVEGHELAVLRGATQTLARPDTTWVFEWSQGQIWTAGQNPADILQVFRAGGFTIYQAETFLPGQANQPWDDAQIMATPYVNLLASRRL